VDLPDERGRREAVGARGTDYVYPARRTRSWGLPAGERRERPKISRSLYAFGQSDWQTAWPPSKVRLRRQETAVVSTINGDANVPFYKELGTKRISAESYSGCRVLGWRGGSYRASTPDPLLGHLAAWNYFESISSRPTSVHRSVAYFHQDQKRTTNDPMEAHYIGFNLWVKAVEQAKTTDVEKVLAALARSRDAKPHRRHASCCRIITSPTGLHRRGEADASLTWSGNPRGLCRAMPGPTTCRAARISKPTGDAECGNYNKVTRVFRTNLQVMKQLPSGGPGCLHAGLLGADSRFTPISNDAGFLSGSVTAGGDVLRQGEYPRTAESGQSSERRAVLTALLEDRPISVTPIRRFYRQAGRGGSPQFNRSAVAESSPPTNTGPSPSWSAVPQAQTNHGHQAKRKSWERKQTGQAIRQSNTAPVRTPLEMIQLVQVDS